MILEINERFLLNTIRAIKNKKIRMNKFIDYVFFL